MIGPKLVNLMFLQSTPSTWKPDKVDFSIYWVLRFANWTWTDNVGFLFITSDSEAPEI